MQKAQFHLLEASHMDHIVNSWALSAQYGFQKV